MLTNLWDAVVLTARDHEQKVSYELQLKEMENFKSYTKRCVVYADEQQDIRIGSGGATLFALEKLSHDYGKDEFKCIRVIFIHSGGYSQRLPICSALGKVFMYLPIGDSLLEQKLKVWSCILEEMPPGFLICSGDTLEFINLPIKFDQITLFGHRSSNEIAQNHGVYVLNENRLVTVLQKPSTDNLSQLINENKKFFTDSCYILMPEVVQALIKFKSENSADLELCCYDDFLGGLGDEPRCGYFLVDEHRAAIRKALSNILRNFSTTVHLFDGEDTFYHFGTTKELMEHFRPESAFLNHFSVKPRESVFSILGANSKLSSTSIIQLCNFPNGIQAEDCIITHCSSKIWLNFPQKVMATTISVHQDGEQGFITAVFHIDEDLKTVKEDLIWFQIPIISEHKQNLWDASLFEIRETAENSLISTLSSINEKKLKNVELISFAEALRKKDIYDMITYKIITKQQSKYI